MTSEDKLTNRLRRVGLFLAVALVVVFGLSGVAAAATTGSLAFQRCVAEPAPNPCVLGKGLGAFHGLVISSDGGYVYVVGKPSNTGRIAIFARDGSTGNISQVSS